MQIPVSKYHGCGNDFIITRKSEVAAMDEKTLRDFIISVCDRHTGIGADGCIFVRENPLEMVYYNQDGSRADMCGNGIRCFANFCFDNEITHEGIYTVSTLAGPQVIAELSRDPFRVQVDMGQPVFDNEKIQAATHEELWNYPLVIENTALQIRSMYMGTIHTVLYVEDAFDPDLERVGDAVCHHPLFRNQTNVNFVEIVDEAHIRASTYERGCGMTLACGTGMCASVAAAVRDGKTGPHVDVEMKKGSLHIDIDKDGSVFLTGPARCIMKGIFEYDPPEPQTAA